MFTAPHIYLAVSFLARLLPEKYAGTALTDKLSNLNQIRKKVLEQLSQELQYKESIRVVKGRESFEAEMDSASTVVSARTGSLATTLDNNNRLLQYSVMPSSAFINT